MIERAAIATVAVAAAVFGVLWFHSAHLSAQAQAIANHPPQQLTRAQVDHAVDLFERARTDNPDSRPIVLEAGLLIRVKRDRQALALLKPLVKREPDNLTAWSLTVSAANTVDPPLARAAYKRALELNPLAAPKR